MPLKVVLFAYSQGIVSSGIERALDGVKLPGNASKARSGTRADFLHRAQKLEVAARAMVDRRRENAPPIGGASPATKR